jgi:hypothetical protein
MSPWIRFLVAAIAQNRGPGDVEDFAIELLPKMAEDEMQDGHVIF